MTRTRTRTRTALLVVACAAALVVAAGATLVLRFDPNRYKDLAIDYMATHYQRRLVLDGPISLHVFPRLEVALERVSLSEPGQPEQVFVQLDSAQLAVRVWPLLHQQLVVDRVQATGLLVRYQRDPNGRRNFDDLLRPTAAPAPAPGSSAPDGAGRPLQLDVNAIDLQRLTLEVDDRKLPARGQVRLARFTSGRLSPGTSAPVQLSAAIDFTQPAAQGRLDGDLKLQLDLGDTHHPLHADAKELALHLQGTFGQRPPGDARVKGELSYSGSISSSTPASVGGAPTPSGARWQLGGTLNAQTFQTRGELALGGTRPKVQAEMTFGELDLRAWLPGAPAAPSTTQARAAEAPPRAGPQVDRPVELGGLRSFDGRLTLQADTLRVAPYVLHQLKAVATLDDGRLDLSPLTFATWNGSVQGRVQAAATTPQRMAVALHAQGIDIAQALHDVARSNLLEGRGQVTLDLHSTGRSVAALKAALAGNVQLQLRDGAVRGFNLAKTVRQFQAALLARHDDVARASQTEKTDFSELSASFQFARGVGSNRDLDLKSPFLRLGGEGSVNLPADRLDYTVRAAVINTSKGQDGADLAALHGLVVPVRLEGPFDALNWRIQWSQVATGAAGNTVKRQLGDRLREELRGQLGMPGASEAASQPSDAELRQKARDKLKEELKGLLR